MIKNFTSRNRYSLRRARSKKGQTLVEYSLILAVISVIAIAALSDLGQQIRYIYGTISVQLARAISAVY